MTIHAKGPPPGQEDDPLELSSLGGVDLQVNTPNQALPQEDNRAPEITCASMRVAELRACLVREIARATVLAMHVQANLLDDDDAKALANLRQFWLILRGSIGQLAAELRALTGGRRP